MEYVAVGKVVGTFGVEGELKILPLAPKELFDSLKKVYFKRVGGSYVKFGIEKVKKHGELFLIKFKGYNDLDSVEQFVGATLFLPEKELPERGEGEFYAYELVGMEVVTDDGNNLGRVKRVDNFGAYDMLVLEDENKMVPFVGDIVLSVDRSTRRIEVKGSLLPY